MDQFTLNRAAKKLEKIVIESAEKEGHEIHVRKILRHFLINDITKESVEAIAYGFGILVQNGFMTEKDVMTIMEHLGVIR